MAESAEHLFIKQAIHESISELSTCQLFGLSEMDRKRFDYGCRIDRDWRRALVSQVLWGNVNGLEKDLRTLLHEHHAPIKVYVYQDIVRINQKIHEVIDDYSRSPNTRSLLSGLKLVSLPSDFDADKPDQRHMLVRRLKLQLLQDVLFRVVFRLTRAEMSFFLRYGGVIGLKYALLAHVHEEPVWHMPTFMDKLGYKSRSVIDKCFIMLSALGLIYQPVGQQLYLPTAKGQTVLDVTKSALQAIFAGEPFDSELRLIMRELGSESVLESHEEGLERLRQCDLVDPLQVASTEQFGVSLVEQSRTLSQFYSLRNFERLRQTATLMSDHHWEQYIQSAWGLSASDLVETQPE